MIWILYIILEATAQWFFLIKKGHRPNYIQLFLIRGIAAVLYGAFILGDITDTFQSIGNWLGQVVLPFAFVFNGTLNLLRKKAYDYVGEHSGFIEPIIFKYRLQKHYFYFTVLLFVVDLIWFIRW